MTDITKSKWRELGNFEVIKSGKILIYNSNEFEKKIDLFSSNVKYDYDGQVHLDDKHFYIVRLVWENGSIYEG